MLETEEKQAKQIRTHPGTNNHYFLLKTKFINHNRLIKKHGT
jgi:hypothetical protein